MKNVFVINKHNLGKKNIVFVKIHKNTKQAMIFKMNQNIVYSVFNNQIHIGIHSNVNDENTKIIVFDERNPFNQSLKEYESFKIFNRNASIDAINCAKHVRNFIQ